MAPDFEVDQRNAAAVHEVCRRLDGIPLALELAAARLSVLSVDQLRARLDDRFRLLTGGRRALPRQQTLDAVVRWSYEHLSADEQRLLQRLAVFSGGSTIEAAVFVSAADAPEHQVIEQLSSLAAKSLIGLDSTGPEPRHRLLETVRLFALERLDDGGRAGDARDRHLAFFEKRAAELTHHPDPGIRSRSSALLDADRENLIAALRHGGGSETAWRLARSLGRYWEGRGMLEVGYSLLEAMFSATGPGIQGATRIMALQDLRIVASATGRFRRSLELAEEQLRLSRVLGDQEGEFSALLGMAAPALALDDAPQAWRHLESMEALAAQRPDSALQLRHYRAETLRALGRLDEAEDLYRHNLDEAATHAWASQVINEAINLALLSLARPDLDAARAWIERVIEARGQGDQGSTAFPTSCSSPRPCMPRTRTARRQRACTERPRRTCSAPARDSSRSTWRPWRPSCRRRARPFPPTRTRRPSTKAARSIHGRSCRWRPTVFLAGWIERLGPDPGRLRQPASGLPRGTFKSRRQASTAATTLPTAISCHSRRARSDQHATGSTVAKASQLRANSTRRPWASASQTACRSQRLASAVRPAACAAWPPIAAPGVPARRGQC
ncbi:hypothetical protein [uncultured Piscinibacter sp.]|uniref:ATP-binding protein n=1 Tax=uncultured Piscinibacter sp. TaxID=1131835 RepID=UPI0026154198|nr:hypothetical protein [uncultured Piscinibacter sp.]